VRWVEGEPADLAPVTRREAAEILAGFLRALHHQAPADAPASPARGIPLAGLEHVDDWFAVIAGHPDAGAARDVWEAALAAPVWQGAPVWLHGDLHPANVIVRDGTPAGVIDFGELCGGDPAPGLSAAWICCRPAPRVGSSTPTSRPTRPPSSGPAGGLCCAPCT
jgi:aminoglycoside phosphotransferase (APT) family kinase protein